MSSGAQEDSKGHERECQRVWCNGSQEKVTSSGWGKMTAVHRDPSVQRGELGKNASHPWSAGVLAVECAPPGWGCTSCLSPHDPDHPRTTGGPTESVLHTEAKHTFSTSKTVGVLEKMEMCPFLPPSHSNGDSSNFFKSLQSWTLGFHTSHGLSCSILTTL